MTDKTKNNYNSRKTNTLNSDFSKNLNQLIEDQSSKIKIKLEKISNPFQGLSEKMIFSTSRDDKKVLLWDERTGDVVFSYEDESVKTYVPSGKLQILGVYSEYLIATQENKSMFLVWKSDTVDAVFKSSPVEEKVTVFKPTNNCLFLVVGTDTGKVYIFELFSGNVLASFQAHLERVNDLEISYDSSIIITCSKDNTIRLFQLEKYIFNFYQFSILDNCTGRNNSVTSSQNVAPMFEAVVGNKELLYLKQCGVPTYLVFGVTKDHTLIVSFNLNFQVFDYPKLNVLKKIYFNDSLLTFSFNLAFTDLFIIQNKRVYFLKVEEIFTKGETNLSQDTLRKVIETEKAITAFCIGSKYLLAGMEDGVIGLYDLRSFKFVNNVSNHRGKRNFLNNLGPVTNIICANRPISQFGLSYNNKISNLIVKQMKKANTNYGHVVSVATNRVNCDIFLEEFLEKSCENQENYLSFVKLQEEVSNKSKKIDNEVKKSEFDEKFLQRKLGEAYLLLKNK